MNLAVEDRRVDLTLPIYLRHPAPREGVEKHERVEPDGYVYGVLKEHRPGRAPCYIVSVRYLDEGARLGYLQRALADPGMCVASASDDYYRLANEAVEVFDALPEPPSP